MWPRFTPAPTVDSSADVAAALRQRIAELENRLLRQRQIENQLLESEQQYKSLFDFNFDAIITIDRDARILTANPAAARLSGYPLLELRGLPISRLCAPDVLTETLRSLNRAFLGEPQDTESALLTKDGQRIAVYCTGGPLRVGGQVVGVFAIVRDITLQRHTEELLRAAQAETELRFHENTLRYRQLFECATDAVLVGDVTDYVFEEANPAAIRLLGYTAAELTGFGVYQLSAEPSQSKANRDRMLAGPHPLVLRFHRAVRRKDGTAFLADVSLGTFLANDRVKFIGIFRDISDRLRLEREVLDIGQREQRRIGNDIEESICRPLEDVVAACQSLDLPADLRAQTDHVRAALAEARALARGLQSVDLQAHTLATALAALADRATRVFHIPCQFQHDAGAVLPDEQSARQFYLIAQEAISYAARHQRAEHLWLHLAAATGRVTLSVRDDGHDPDPATASANGLAVRVMRYRAELIGATFDASPAGPTGGTIISCSLPAPRP